MDWFYWNPLTKMAMYKNLECRRNGTYLTFESRQNGVGETGEGEMGVGEMGIPHLDVIGF